MKIEYQVCKIGKNKEESQVVGTIKAETIKEAYETAHTMNPETLVAVYPLVTLDNPDSIMAMAETALASVENWERRNNYAVLNPINRNQWDREDYVSIATIAIIATLTDDPGATMHTVKTTAFTAIRAEQGRNERKSEREYNPGWTVCNVQPREPRSSCPELDKLIREAIHSADLTGAQTELFALSYDNGMSAADIADITGKSRAAVYRGLYRAYYKILAMAIDIDATGDTFRRAGYTTDDITETLATLKKRAGGK